MGVPKGLLSIRQAAELIGAHPKTLLRRLTRLHEQHGGVLVSFERPGAKVRKYFIQRDRLMEVWSHESEEDFTDDEKDEAEKFRIEEFEAKLLALRAAHRKTRAELAALRREMQGRLARLEGRHLRDAA